MKKEIKGYIAEDFAKKGWTGKDCAIFVYRRVKKSEKWFVPVKIIIEQNRRVNVK